MEKLEEIFDKMYDWFILIVPPILIIIILVVMLALTIIVGDRLINYNKYELRKDEWNYKVQKCVLDRSYRSDCEYIIYQDKKNDNPVIVGTIIR